MRTFEFREKTYQEVRTQDLKAGDEVFHSSWFTDGYMNGLFNSGNQYVIISNENGIIKARFKSRPNHEGYSWSHHDFDNGWCIEYTMMEYSPDQQGEDDDSI